MHNAIKLGQNSEGFLKERNTFPLANAFFVS